MKLKPLFNISLGIATEVLYTAVIMLAAFLICIAVLFFKKII